MNPEAQPKPVVEDEKDTNELIDGVDENQAEETEDTEEQVEDPEYSLEDTQGIARAAAGATDVLEGAVSGDRRMNTSFTSNGVRNVVEAPVSGAHVRGEFDGNNDLEKVEITLGDGAGQEVPIAVDLRNPNNPRVTVDGQAVDPDKIPAVNDMIEQIKSSTADKPEEPLTEAEADEDDNEKIAA